MIRLVAKNKKNSKKSAELDSVYFLKLVLYFIVGTFWLHIVVGDAEIPLPLGLLFGVAFASHEHFQIDRKIEYAVLLIAVFLAYFVSPRLVVVL